MKSTKRDKKRYREICVLCVCTHALYVTNRTWSPACRQIAFIYTALPAYSSEGRSRAKEKIDLRKWLKWGGLHGRWPPPALQDLTSAARPILTDLKAVSTETEGAVSRHDATITAPELVAGWQELCRGGREKVRVVKKIGMEDQAGRELTFWFGKLLFFLSWLLHFAKKKKSTWSSQV